MKNYEYLDHTADLKIRATGKNLEETFANLAIGAFDFLTDTKKVERKTEKKINISANRIESLLYDFMEELLFLLDTDGLIFSEIKDLKISEDKKNNTFSLQCSALGDSYKNYDVKGNIKSVTYSEMKIENTKDNCIIEVVLDI